MWPFIYQPSFFRVESGNRLRKCRIKIYKTPNDIFMTSYREYLRQSKLCVFFFEILISIQFEELDSYSEEKKTNEGFWQKYVAKEIWKNSLKFVTALSSFLTNFIIFALMILKTENFYLLQFADEDVWREVENVPWNFFSILSNIIDESI